MKSARSSSPMGETPSAEHSAEVRGKRQRTPFTYRVCEGATEALVYFMVIFTPWAFGTTQDWSIWTMNITGYLLGALLGAKWLIRWKTGYMPPRWGAPPEGDGLIIDPDHTGKGGKIWTASLVVLTLAILAYTLASALNPRAVYYPSEYRFEYQDYIQWLPHSYDPLSTWSALWSYIGFACFFWALRDWLLGKTARERRTRREDASEREMALSGPGRLPRDTVAQLPDRLQRLLWVLCINGSILALEAILQRLSGTNKLLWLIVPRMITTADSQFGPFAYRSNAASYFNLLWPVCVGFWLLLRRISLRNRTKRVGGGSYVVLLPCAVLMAAAPIISTARGGALIAMANILAVCVLLLVATRRESGIIRASMLSLFLIILLFGGYLGWEQLSARLENIFVDQLSNRIEIYENAAPLARDFPLFGTGPGSFSTIYRLYKDPKQVWEAYLHDDWMETRITFGWIGFGLIMLALLLSLARWLVRGGIPISFEFVSMIWVAIGGCLAHAKFDFPLQVYSIQLLFLALCSILLSVSRK